jgi:CRP/FNR family transcriptional regulator
LISDRSWLELFPALNKVRDAAWLETLGNVQLMQVAKGQRLFQYGDGCKGYVLVISGSVRVQKVDPQGHEIVLYRVEDGQSCMLTTICLMGSRDYPAEGIAETDVTLAIISLLDFERSLVASAGFRKFVMGSISHRVCDLMQLVEDVAFGRMDVRLARLLLKCVGDSSKLDCTHQDLAFELGTAREVVSRLLKDFERRDYIRLGRGSIEISCVPALREIAQ